MAHQQKRSTVVAAVEKDLTEDPVDITLVRSVAVPDGLRERFLSRMSRILHASVSMREDVVKNSVDIFISYRDSRPRHITKKDLTEVEDTLASIAQLSRGASLEKAEENLWEVFLLLSYFDARAAIRFLRGCFKDYHDIFADFITTMFGFGDDYSYSETNQELGGRIIKLFQAVETYDGSLKETNNLIHIAATITKESKLKERLAYLIKDASFANELFELICKLSFPKRAYGSLLSVARTTTTFKNVAFRDNSSTSAMNIPSPTKAQPCLYNFNETGYGIQPENTCTTLESPLTPLTPLSPSSPLSSSTPSTPLTPLTPPAQLFPAQRNGSQQEVALLIETISRNQLLPKQESAWYSFGFVCTRDEEEERLLAGLYAVILQEADSVQIIFHELHYALETHSLVALFLAKGYECFRESFPYLEAFLSTPPERRPTVWRLKQFIQDSDKTEPPACLRRDYGFKMCKQREEVGRLKAIYAKVLNKTKPEDLHAACLYGRLLEAVIREGVAFNENDRRLMQNDYPSPFIGFDNDAGLAGYRLPLFKKQKF